VLQEVVTLYSVLERAVRDTLLRFPSHPAALTGVFPPCRYPSVWGILHRGRMGEREDGSGMKTQLGDWVVRSRLHWFLFAGLMVLKATWCAAWKLFLLYVQSLSASDWASTARALVWPCRGAPLTWNTLQPVGLLQLRS